MQQTTPPQHQLGTCPICVQPLRDIQIKIHEVSSDNRSLGPTHFSVWRCPQCGTIQSLDATPRTQIFENYSFAKQKESYFNWIVNQNTLAIFKNKFKLGKTELFLAYGIRNNVFLKFLNKKIDRFFGFDPFYPKYSDKEYITKRHYDFIFMENIFSQYEDPRATLKETHTFLNKGGILCLQVPSADHIDLLQSDNYRLELHAPYHRYIYRAETLTRLAEEAGFDLVQHTPRCFADTLFPFVNWRFMREYVRCADNTADALFEPGNRLQILLKNPHLLLSGLLGYFFNEKTYMTLFFKKKVGGKCQLCGGGNLSFVYKETYEKMDLVRCRDCGVVFLDIGRCSSAEFYQDTYYPKEPLIFEKIDAAVRSRKIQRLVQPGARVFEMGCGHGLLLKKLDKADYEVYGNEFSETAGDYAKNRLFLKIKTGDADGMPWDGKKYDAICLYHVFEHLDNPVEALGDFAGRLNPEGWLVLEVPNYDCVYSRIFGRKWFMLDLPRHIFHYNHKSLTRLLEANGFSVKKTESRYFLYDIFGNTLSTLNLFLKTQNVLNGKEVYLPWTWKDVLARRQAYFDFLIACTLAPALITFYTVIYFIFKVLSIPGGTATVYAQRKS